MDNDALAAPLSRRSNPATVLALTIPAVAEGIAEARHELDAWLLGRGVPDTLRGDVILLADEAIANAVEHGLREVDGGEVLVTATADEDTVIVTVADRGRWRPERGESGISHGWGLPLMKSLADRVDIDSTSAGTSVTAWFSRHDTAPGAGSPPTT